MKVKAFLTILLALPFQAIAQQDAPDGENRRMFEHQLGINASAFITSVLRLTLPLSGSPYQFNYKLLYNLSPEKAFISSAGLRFGAGRLKENSETDNTTNQSVFTREFLSTDLRAGIEAQKSLNRFWTTYVGFDYMSHAFTNDTRNRFKSQGMEITAVTTESERSEGYGPVFGIQFNANKHICLSTELAYYSVKGSSTSYQSSGFPWNPPQLSYQKFTRSEVITPFFVNFSVRF